MWNVGVAKIVCNIIGEGAKFFKGLCGGRQNFAKFCPPLGLKKILALFLDPIENLAPSPINRYRPLSVKNDSPLECIPMVHNVS